MKNKILKFFIFTYSLTIVFSLSSCKSDEERFWDSVEINPNTNSFAFVFTSSIIPFAGDYASPIINRVKNDNVKSKQVVFLSLYPSVLDPLYDPTSEKLFFEYDASGNNTFSNYPAFVNNTQMFNFDTTAFFKSISDKALTVSPINIGTLIKADQGELTFYVKVLYNQDFNKKHSLAIYLYEKEKVAKQETTSGEIINFTHRNVFMNSVNNELFGEIIPGTFTSGQEGQYEYTYTIEDYNLNNLGILTIVYELDENNKPVDVINITSN